MGSIRIVLSTLSKSAVANGDSKSRSILNSTLLSDPTIVYQKALANVSATEIFASNYALRLIMKSATLKKLDDVFIIHMYISLFYVS